MLQVSIFGQTLSGVKELATTDTGAPDTNVIAVFQFGEVGEETVLIQIIYLFLAGQLLVTRQGDDLHTRSHHEECHIETDLIVAGTC